MTWLYQFFNRNTCQERTPSTSPEAATTNPPKQPSSTTMMQLVAEETIMAVAQWLVTMVNRRIQTKPEAPVEPTPAPQVNSTPVMEELLSKFGKLIEQLYEREQQIIPLENRLRQVEAALLKKGELEHQFQESLQLLDRLNQRLIRVEDLAGRVNINELDILTETIEQFTQQADHSSHTIERLTETTEQLTQQADHSSKAINILTETTEQLTQQADHSSGTIALLDTRIIQLEAGMKQNNSLIEKINQIHQSMAALEHRMGHLEGLLAKFSTVPKKIAEENWVLPNLW